MEEREMFTRVSPGKIPARVPKPRTRNEPSRVHHQSSLLLHRSHRLMRLKPTLIRMGFQPDA